MLQAVDPRRKRVEPARELGAHVLERGLELGQRLLDLRASERVDVGPRRTKATSSCALDGSPRSRDASSLAGAVAAVVLAVVGAVGRLATLSPAVSVRPAIFRGA